MSSRLGALALLSLTFLITPITRPDASALAQERGMLRGRVLDAATGAPTSCTVTIIDSKGNVVLEKESFRGGFRCHGEFAKSLPAGRTQLRVSRGLETRMVERVLEIPAGGEREEVIHLHRVADLRQRGWYAGDSHVHMIHGERTIPVDFDDIALAAQAQDLQYLSLAQAWNIESVTPEKLEAELGPRSTSTCVLTWNLEAPKNYYRGDAGRCLGHCWTLATRGRTSNGDSVIDLLLNASAHDYESDKPTFANFESHQLIHAQGGVVFYTHPARWWTGSWGGQGGYPVRDKMRVSNMAVELPLDLLIGPTFDGLDVLTGAGEFEANALAFQLWCLLLNHGYRVTATASSDATFDRPGGGVPGTARIYTWLGEPFSLSATARAAAQGHTFVTTGPLLLVSVDGQPPGTAFAAGQPHRLEVSAWASGFDSKGLTRIELLRNGQTVQTNWITSPTPTFSTNLTIADTDSAWYALRLFGGDARSQRAISGAFFFDAQPFAPPAPVPARISAELVDANTGAQLSGGSVTEVSFRATQPIEGRTTAAPDGRVSVVLPGTSRLRAQAEGYRPQMLSPFLDNPGLVTYITRLTAEDLVKWETFERVRQLLSDVKLRFALQKN